MVQPHWSTAVVVVVYLGVVTAVNWRTRTWDLLLYPLYAAVYSLVLVPIGVWAYLRMALTHRNAGVIRTRAAASTADPVAV